MSSMTVVFVSDAIFFFLLNYTPLYSSKMDNKFEKLYPSASFLKIDETEDGHVANFRLKCATVDEFKKWLKHHQQVSGVTYRVQTTTPCTGKKVIYKAYYRCQHNTYPNSHKIKSPSLKHTGCQGKLKISIQSTSPTNIKSKDKLRIEFPSIVEVQFKHNHNLLVAEALKFKDVGDECKEKFLDLFRSHHGPAKALELHKQDLMEQYEDEYYIAAADRSICPDINWVHYFYNNMFKIEFGEAKNDVLSTIRELVAENPEFTKFEIIDGNFVLAACPPLMRRAHEVTHSSHVCFLDSSGNMDRFNCRIFLLMTDSCVGGLPLGILISSSESEKTITTGLRLLKQVLPPNSFGGKHFPAMFLTDNSLAEQNAITTVFPQSTIWLCSFHVLQAVWRWLNEAKHNISRHHRQELYKLFKSILIAEKLDQAERAIIAVNESAVVALNPAFHKYFESLLLSFDKWAQCKRTLTRGNNTNNMVESAINVLKERILNRTRAYNIKQLFHYLTVDMENYYNRKIIDIISGRYSKYRHMRYLPCTKKIKDLQLVGQEDEVFVVYNKASQTEYEVNLILGICTCFIGKSGQPCKHQHFVAIKENAKCGNIVPINENERKFFHWIATGLYNVPDNWYAPLITDTNKNSNVENKMSTDDCNNTNHNNEDIIPQQPSINIDEFKEAVVSMTQLLQNKLENDFENNPEEYTSAVHAMTKQIQSMKSQSGLLSAMQSFGKQNVVPRKRVGNIPVQPTSVSRRKNKHFSRRTAPQGRPAKLKLAEHTYAKRRKMLGQQQQRVPKAPHCLDQCVARNISLGL